MEEVVIERLVHGGQGLATRPDGQKVFVWNALPGETVAIRIIKKKRSYAEAIAEEILTASEERCLPREPNYLATSPWQMMQFGAENRYKSEIVTELFAREGITHEVPSVALSDGIEWQYRNKMEYSFWGDDDGLHLALHRRGSHGKQIVDGSELALPALDAGARAVLADLQTKNVRAGDLKSLIVRTNQAGQTVAALYVKPTEFAEPILSPELQGYKIYHSDPRSPAAVPTKLLHQVGDTTLTDTILAKPFVYSVDSFFQVNLPMFELALGAIKEHTQAATLTDMYAGVGSIGLSVAKQAVDLIELDPASSKMAQQNAANSGLLVHVEQASTEKALDYITADTPVIFDPPRAGLHDKVIARVLETLPPRVIYLSCNPATQARDVARLQTAYRIDYLQVFNFFPKTPHIETLVILSRR